MRNSYQLSAISHQPEGGTLCVVDGRHTSIHKPRTTNYELHTTSAAFSLVEMMIAIMILGLGMVMAATVFPVSLDMTKGTLQINISQTAADVAAGTLAIRVPHYDTSLLPAPTEYRVALPDMYARELHYPVNVGDPWIDQDKLLANLDAIDGTLPLPYTLPDLLSGAQLMRARLYTGQSFWDAERDTSAQISAYVIAAQNMQAGLNVIADLPPGYLAIPRISIADRVYPPVDLYRVDGTVRPLLNSDPNDLGVLDEISSRRYCWTALHYKDLHDLTRSGYYCQIVVLYRSNLDSRYIRQRPATAGAKAPQPAETNVDDTIFPQAWLVTVHINGPAGEIRCTSNVAALLPAGSFVITADQTLYKSPGMFTKILKNNWQGEATDPDNLATWTTLQIKPGEFIEPDLSMRIWVFPPAIQNALPAGRSLDVYPNKGNVQFETVSPVIDVVPKKVNAG